MALHKAYIGCRWRRRTPPRPMREISLRPGAITIGPKVRTIARDAWQNVRKLVEQLFAQGYSCEHIWGEMDQREGCPPMLSPEFL